MVARIRLTAERTSLGAAPTAAPIGATTGAAGDCLLRFNSLGGRAKRLNSQSLRQAYCAAEELIPHRIGWAYNGTEL